MKNILTTIFQKLKPTISEDDEDLQILKSIGSKEGYDWSRSIKHDIKKLMQSKEWLDFLSSERGVRSPSLEKALEERLCEVELELKKNIKSPAAKPPYCVEEARKPLTDEHYTLIAAHHPQGEFIEPEITDDWADDCEAHKKNDGVL